MTSELEDISNAGPLVVSELPDPFLKDKSPPPNSSQQSFGYSSQITVTGPVTDVPLQSETSGSGHINYTLPTATTSSLTIADPVKENGTEDSPELHIPGLVVSNLFLPVPNTDPLSTLLAKYISDPNQRPPRDLSGSYKDKDFYTLVMSNSWRSLAKMARDRIVATPPSELSLILELWYIRLSSLARMRLYNQASAECTSLFTVLNGVEPPAARTRLFDEVLPFELEVINARVRYWSDDHIGYLDALMMLLNKCKRRAKECTKASNENGYNMWVERGTRVTLIIASQLIEMKDVLSAARLLTPLTQQPNASPAIFSAIGRIYLHCGHLEMVNKYFSIVENHPKADETSKNMNRAIMGIAYGNYEEAVQCLERILEVDPDNAIAANNLAVALFGTGKTQEAIEIMERMFKVSPSAIASTEPWLLNLSSLYELHSSDTWDKKRNLLIDVAKWSGDGVRVSALRLPAT